MWASQRRKWILGGVSVVLLGLALLLLRGDEPEKIPPDLDARARYVATALLARNLQNFQRLTGGESGLYEDDWYEAAQSAIPDVLRDPKLNVIYNTETKFENGNKGIACNLVTIVPSNVDLANEIADDASLLEAELLLYWERNSAGEWSMDCGKCLRAFRMDRGTNWSGRLGDRKNFRQANQ